MKSLRTSLVSSALCLATGLFSMSSQAALEPFQTYNGNVAMSSDGFASLSNSGNISASVPSGSTVLAAYLYSATFSTTSTPSVTLDGNSVSFGPRVPNTTACCSLASFRADVTSIVAPKIEGGSGGVYNFDISETALGNRTDGEALVVIYKNASLPEATVAILDGFASVTGDTAAINFAEALSPSDPGFFVEMNLGISFSCCSQKSRVEVNGELLTENAGNFDDADVQNAANGRLFTMGGFDDPISPVLPTYEEDSERYDLTSFVDDGDTTISVKTSNASRDDNIFFAGFYASGFAAVNEEPEPPTTSVSEPSALFLLGLGMAGFVASRRKQVK